jgi:quercetin dioxygenase-like cupin family protein
MDAGLRKVSDPHRIDVGNLEVRELVGVEQGVEWGTLFDVHFSPGAHVPWHVHTYDEVGVAQEGVVEMHVGREVFHPKVGELVLIPAGTPHEVIAHDGGRHLAMAHTRSDAMHDGDNTVLVDGPDGNPLPR